MENREKISAEIGERIRKFRTQQKMSQESLALEAGLHQAYIGKIERGEKCPTVDTLNRIAVGLHIPLSKLIDVHADMQVSQTDAYRRIQAALDGLAPEEMLEIARIVEQITALMQRA